MNEKKNTVVKVVLDFLREIFSIATYRGRGGKVDYFANRILIASSQSSFSGATEKLIEIMEVDTGRLKSSLFADYIRLEKTEHAPQILYWMRKNHKIIAKIASLDSIDYGKIINDLDDNIFPEADSDGVAIPDREYAIGITAKLLSPLSHGSETKAGNATFYRTMTVLSDKGKALELPYYSGLAVRGQMRDLLADDFISSLGLTPSRNKLDIELWLFQILYSGGTLEEGGKAAKEISAKLGKNGAVYGEGYYELRNMLPATSLLGTALGDRTLPGHVLSFGDLRPRCKQWSNGIGDVAELYMWEFLTHRDDFEGREKKTKGSSDNEAENISMIANLQCLRVGTELVGGIETGNHMSELELSCLGRGLDLLAERGYLGGKNGDKFGRVQLEYTNKPDATMYLDYLASNKDKILAYIKEIGGLGESS